HLRAGLRHLLAHRAGAAPHAFKASQEHLAARRARADHPGDHRHLPHSLGKATRMQYRLTGLTIATLSGAVLCPAVAGAQTLDLSITIPKISAAEYHKPYVAIWLEKE